MLLVDNNGWLSYLLRRVKRLLLLLLLLLLLPQLLEVKRSDVASAVSPAAAVRGIAITVAKAQLKEQENIVSKKGKFLGQNKVQKVPNMYG